MDAVSPSVNLGLKGLPAIQLTLVARVRERI
jgi:hypothetical protein